MAEVEAGQEMQVEGAGGVDADGARDRSAESVGGSRRGGTAGAAAAARSTARRAGARGVHPADGRAGGPPHGRRCNLRTLRCRSLSLGELLGDTFADFGPICGLAYGVLIQNANQMPPAGASLFQPL